MASARKKTIATDNLYLKVNIDPIALVEGVLRRRPDLRGTNAPTGNANLDELIETVSGWADSEKTESMSHAELSEVLHLAGRDERKPAYKAVHLFDKTQMATYQLIAGTYREMCAGFLQHHGWSAQDEIIEQLCVMSHFSEKTPYVVIASASIDAAARKAFDAVQSDYRAAFTTLREKHG